MEPIDELFSLETVYYSAPVPRNAATLTALGLIFDRVHFPGVYLPMGGYDVADYAKELDRLLALPPNLMNQEVIGVYEFAQYAPILKDFCVFSGTESDTFGNANGATDAFIRDIEEAIHGPPPSNFIPTVETGFNKSIPGSDQSVAYPGPYHYLAGALLEAQRLGVPIVNDLPGLPVPGLPQKGNPKGDVKALAGLLALTSTAMVLPEILPMRPAELMEFRAKNKAPLRRFRRAMVKHAGKLSAQLSSEMEAAEASKVTEFYVKTEIIPEFDELAEVASLSNRRLGSRLDDLSSFAIDLAASLVVADPKLAITIALLKSVPKLFIREAAAALDKGNTDQGSDLFYLLRVRETRHR